MDSCILLDLFPERDLTIEPTDIPVSPIAEMTEMRPASPGMYFDLTFFSLFHLPPSGPEVPDPAFAEEDSVEEGEIAEASPVSPDMHLF